MPGSGAPSPALAPSPPSEANVESDVEDHSFAGVASVVSSGSSSLLASERSGSLVVFPIERSSPALEPRALTAEIPRETPPAFAHVATTTTAEEVAKDNDLPAVQVYVRLRPLLEWEQTSGHESTSLDIEDCPLRRWNCLGQANEISVFLFCCHVLCNPIVLSAFLRCMSPLRASLACPSSSQPPLLSVSYCILALCVLLMVFPTDLRSL